MFFLSTKQKNHNTFNPKELNRKQLQQQNLIFIISGIIIIVGLIVVVIYTINFLVNQMDEIFENVKNTDINLEGFDVKGFNEIKEKLHLESGEIERFLEEINKTTPLPTITPIQSFINTIPTNSFIEQEITTTPENISPNNIDNSLLNSTPIINPTTTLTITPIPD